MAWKPIKNYETLYEVSDFGEVRSLDREIDANINHVKRRIIKGRILKQNTKKNGYKTVDLSQNKKVKTVLVHRLVAEAFVPNPDNKYFVNHIDSNRSNNKAINLEWVTSSENRKHGISCGNVVFRQTRKVRCKETGQVFEQAKIAANWLMKTYPERCHGTIVVTAQNIRASCNGKAPRAYGFSWEFL